MRTKAVVWCAVIALVLVPATLFALTGEQLFRDNCAGCHTVGKGKLVGPDLKGSGMRHSEDWLLRWVKSSQTMIGTGDADAVKLYRDNDQILMPDFSLSDDEIKSVLAWVKAEGGNSPGDGLLAQAGESMQPGSPGYMLLFVIILFLTATWAGVRTIKLFSIKN